MQFSLILTAVVFTTWINLVQALIGPVNTCPCVAYSNTKVPHTKIKEYTIQKEVDCPFRAIVFQTVSGRKICSNPNNDWANNVIRQLEKRQNEKISKPGLEPTSTTAPSTPTSGSEQTSTARSVPGSEPSTPGSEPVSPPASVQQTPASAQSIPTLPRSELTSEPTLSPSTKTSTSLTTPNSAPSATTLTPVSSTPNPQSASTPNIAVASGTRLPCECALAMSQTTRKASTQRRQKPRRRQNKRKIKKWQKRCKNTK